MKVVRPVGGRLGPRSSTARRGKPLRKRNATTQAAEGNLGGFCVEALSAVVFMAQQQLVRHAIDEMVFAAALALHEDEGGACRIRLSVEPVLNVLAACRATNVSIIAQHRPWQRPAHDLGQCSRCTYRGRACHG
jgi:hypothetical protein